MWRTLRSLRLIHQVGPTDATLQTESATDSLPPGTPPRPSVAPQGLKFELDADEPEILLGQDQGPNAGEYLLHALAACVTTAMVYHAAARGIAIEEVESSIDGDIDLRGFLGIDPKVRNGFQKIRMNFRIKADVPDEQLQELCTIGQQYSPVFDSITHGVPVKIAAERMA